MRNRHAALAAAEWLLVLPAGLLIAFAVFQQLHVRVLERIPPISIPRGCAALIFLGLPALASAIGASVMAATWRRDTQLRSDVKAALSIVWRNAAVGVLALATLAAAAILAMSVVHMITD